MLRVVIFERVLLLTRGDHQARVLNQTVQEFGLDRHLPLFMLLQLFYYQVTRRHVKWQFLVRLQIWLYQGRESGVHIFLDIFRVGYAHFLVVVDSFKHFQCFLNISLLGVEVINFTARIFPWGTLKVEFNRIFL